VRSASYESFSHILEAANSVPNNDPFIFTDIEPGASNYETEVWEGGERQVFSTKYERNRGLRDQAIAIHGLTCKGCGINFRTIYGAWGDGFIHVHHLKPVSGGKQIVRPATDLIVVCANCHSMIHRRKNQLLTIVEVQQLIAQSLVAP
jgi:putative restriction endonuclease